MQLIYKALLPCFPPTLNHQTKLGKGGFRSSPEYKTFKSEAEYWLWETGCPKIESLDQDDVFYLHVDFFWSRWITKKNKPSMKLDCSNRYKAIEDAVFTYMGIDDALNFGFSGRKRSPSDEKDKYVVVYLFSYDLRQEVPLAYIDQTE